MICPKWLIQSSAAGAAGLGLLAMPLWVVEDSTPPEPRPEVQWVEPVVVNTDVVKADEDFPPSLLLPDEMTWENPRDEEWTLICGPPSAQWCVDVW